jgi:hypothetical protein
MILRRRCWRTAHFLCVTLTTLLQSELLIMWLDLTVLQSNDVCLCMHLIILLLNAIFVLERG